jgi:hypothetical protein
MEGGDECAFLAHCSRPLDSTYYNLSGAESTNRELKMSKKQRKLKILEKDSSFKVSNT